MFAWSSVFVACVGLLIPFDFSLLVSFCDLAGTGNSAITLHNDILGQAASFVDFRQTRRIKINFILEI